MTVCWSPKATHNKLVTNLLQKLEKRFAFAFETKLI